MKEYVIYINGLNKRDLRFYLLLVDVFGKDVIVNEVKEIGDDSYKVFVKANSASSKIVFGLDAKTSFSYSEI